MTNREDARADYERFRAYRDEATLKLQRLIRDLADAEASLALSKLRYENDRHDVAGLRERMERAAEEMATFERRMFEVDRLRSWSS